MKKLFLKTTRRLLRSGLSLILAFLMIAAQIPLNQVPLAAASIQQGPANWVTRSSDTTYNLNGIAYSNNIYIAVGDNGTILRSTDGTSWSTVNAGTNSDFKSVTFGNGLFMASTAGFTIHTSDDGINWTTYNLSNINSIYRMAYGNGKFVGITGFGDVAVSGDNGVTWTSSDASNGYTPPTAPLTGVAFDGAKFIASAASLGVNYVFSSLDGLNWSKITQWDSGGTDADRIVYGNNTTVVLERYGYAHTSNDGENWANYNTGASNNSLWGAAYGDNFFVLAGNWGTIRISTDGVTWTGGNSPTTKNLQSVVYDGSTFIAVGAQGTIIQSVPPVINEALTVSNPSTTGFTVNLSPALTGLAGNDFILKDDQNNSVSITSAATPDNGATYTIIAALTAGKTYTVTAAKTGYDFGTTLNLSVPASATPTSIPLAAGYISGYALKSDGTVWAWGANHYGQLGNNSTTNSSVPVQVSNLSGVIAISGTGCSGYALKSDGTVWAWGQNIHHELGNNSTTNSYVPVQVSNLTGVIAIAGGSVYGYALKSDGTVWAWGNNMYGQLGNNTTTDSNVPAQVSNLSGITAIAAGAYSGYALKSDGTVWSWGYNGSGGLGNNTTTDSHVPVQVSSLSGITTIAAGSYSGYALKSDGTVWSWGYNGSGGLGNNSTADSHVPVQISNLTGVIAIANGKGKSGYALKSDGTVWAWGLNEYGQLGNNSTTQSNVPVQVSNLSNVTAITGGLNSGYALKSDGTVWSWGYNGAGQLGNNSTTASHVPVQVSGLTLVVQPIPIPISDFACTGKTDTTASFSFSAPAGATTVKVQQSNNGGATWTDSVTGALTASSTTVTVTGLTEYTDYRFKLVVTGGSHAGDSNVVDVTTNATIINEALTVSNPSTTGFTVTLSPALAGLTSSDFILKDDQDNAVTITSAATSYNGATYTISAELTAGKTYTVTAVKIGYNFGSAANVAVPASAAPASKPLAAGFFAGYALKDGVVWAWGNNSYGQLGNNSITWSEKVPVQVSNLTGVTAITGGIYSGYAVKSDGTVWSWGWNNYGQLGNNSQTDSLIPVQISGLTGVTAIAAGEISGYAVKSDGTVWSWGDNDYGQLGNNSTVRSLIPVQVSGLTGVTAIAAGEYSGYAVKSDGTVWAWGWNYYGQLGDNSTTWSEVPVQVSGLTNVTAIAAGEYSGYALKSDGTVWAWGRNNDGQLGNNSTILSKVPVQVSGLSGVTAIASRGFSSYALKSEGTVWAWGRNDDGQLGNNSYDNSLIPVQVSGLTGVTAIAAGEYSGYALRSDGTVWAWGDNHSGQLGNNVTNNSKVPVQVSGLVIGAQPGQTPISDFTSTGKTDTTASFSFTAPAGATMVKVQQSTDGGTNWTDTTTGILTADSTTATVTGLMQNTAYKFKLVVTGGSHAGDSNIVDVTTEAAVSNNIPTAKSPVPLQSVAVNGTISYTASDIAEDMDDDILTITGIVTAPATATATADLTGGTATITGVAAGSTSMQVTVSDGNGGSVEVTVPITVNPVQRPHPPVANTGGPYVVDIIGLEQGQELMLDGSGSYDPDEASGDHIVSYEWDINGDSVYDFTGDVTLITWTELENLLQPLQYPADPRTGLPEVTIALKVTDSSGKTNVNTATLTIYDRKPVPVPAWGPQPYVPIKPDGTATVRLDGSASYSGMPAYPIVSWKWELTGDPSKFVTGMTTELTIDLKPLPNPFPPQGIQKTLRLAVTNSLGETQYYSFNVVFNILPSQPPNIRFDADRRGKFIEQGEGFMVNANLTADPDPGDWVNRMAWDLNNDGTDDIVWTRTDTNSDGQINSSDAGPNYVLHKTWEDMADYPPLQEIGQHNIRLTVTDNNGVAAQDTVLLTVDLKAMIAKARALPNVGEPGTEINFDGSESSHLFPGQTITAWQWDFDGDGIYDGTGQTAAHTFDALGTCTVMLRVRDAAGHEATDTVTVTVSNTDENNESLTVSNPSTTGFTVTLNPALAGLTAGDFILKDDQNNTVTITSATTSDNGATYTISATLTAGKTYIVTAAKTSYYFGAPENVTVPAVSISDFTSIGKTDTTATFSFTPPAGATVVKIQQSTDGGTTWTDSTASAGLTETSITATVTGLVANTAYKFKLVVTGGSHTGDSNIVDVTTNATIITAIMPLAAGNSSGYAVKWDGTVWAWGNNDYGQLGNNSATRSLVPVQVSGLTGVTGIAAGENSVYALKSDGTVWAWGENDYGQLGNNSATRSLVPVQVSGLTGITAIAAGDSSGYAVKSDGTVWAWGGNYSGQLGNNSNSTTSSKVPVQVSNLTSVIAIAAGDSSGYAIKSDGTVWAWGGNYYGQLGNNSYATKSLVPVQVSNLTGVTAIAGGLDSGYAVKSDGTVWAWGENYRGQLGNNSTADSRVPVQVSGLTGVTAIAAGDYSGYALKSDGTVWVWGANSSGQLGNNSTADSRVPVQVSGLTGITAIAAGKYSGYALRSDGTIWAWGANSSGQLGNNSTANNDVPAQVSGLVISAQSELTLISDFTCTGKTETTADFSFTAPVGAATVKVQHSTDGGANWTDSVTGPLTASSTTAAVTGLTQKTSYKFKLVVTGDTNAVDSNVIDVTTDTAEPAIATASLAAGGNSGYALKPDGTVWAWGDNYRGQLGNNSYIWSYKVPVQVFNLTGVTAITGGLYSGYAVKYDGTVWAWGFNNLGQLGNNSTADSHVPVQVSGLPGVTAVAAGALSGYALKSDGTVWAWGNNYYGQLGNNSTAGSHVPVQVSGLTGVTAIAAGGESGYALKSDGTVWAWGRNNYGKLGNNSTADSHVPVQVSGLTGVTAIAAGDDSGYALKSNGAVWAWGANDSGQLGNNSTADSHVPVQVKDSNGNGLTGFTAIAGGTWSGYALKSDGTVWAWGRNGNGQLGNNSTIKSNVPAQVSGLTGVTAIAAGSSSGYALKSDGTVWAWGYNNYGQLGNNLTTDSHVPVQVSGLVITKALTITTTTLPSARVGTSYSATLSASGGTAPYTWSATGLPVGLSINSSTGVISGTPTAAGTSTVVITIHDSANSTVSKNFSLTVASALGRPGGGGKTTPSENLTAPTVGTDGKVNITVRPKLDSSTGTAAVETNLTTLTDAFNLAKANNTGIKTVEINIPKAEGANAYELTVPASILSAGDTTKTVEMKTEIATVTMPTNMLTAVNTANTQEVSLTIAAVDKSKLSAAVQDRIGNKPVIELELKKDGKTTAWSNRSAPVTVSIPYTPTADELKDPEHITVWYIDGKGNVVEVPSGRYDPATGTVIFSTTHFSTYAVVYVPATSAVSGVTRLAGLTRVDTALTVAKATYPDKVDNAVLATADNYPDALAGSVLAYKLNAPILLVGSSEADQQKVLDYLKANLDPEGTVYILGGTAVVGSSMEGKITASGFSHLTRIAGADRYETSVKIAEQLEVKAGTPVVLVSGENYPDALSVSSIAAQRQIPVLLVQKDGLGDAVRQEIAAIKPGKVYIIGLQGVISLAVENQIAQITGLAATDIVRIGGTDRYATSLAVAQYFNLGGQIVCIATGNDFPDALAGSVYAAKHKAPIILANGSLSEQAMNYLKSEKPAGTAIFGGEAVVGKDIERQLGQLVGQ